MASLWEYGLSLELHDPRLEPVAALRERHIGREEVVHALESGAKAFAAGSHPLPIYLFGPSGVGKSHLLALAYHGMQPALQRAGVRILSLPDDLSTQRSSKHLLELLYRSEAVWPGWEQGWPLESGGSPRVVLLEGLDRHLAALDQQERRRLRHALESESLWLVATGSKLCEELTGRDEAFYGYFDPWPLEPLSQTESYALLASEQGACASPSPTERGLALVAEGNPRILLMMAELVRKAAGGRAFDILRAVLQRLTPIYRASFRALSPQSQRLVEELALSPVELGPVDLAKRLGTTATQASVQARRLLEDGFLHVHSKGRRAWYGLREALFRYWLESRLTRWSGTRVAWLIPLLEEALALDAATLSPRVVTSEFLVELGLGFRGESIEPLSWGKTLAEATDAEWTTCLEKARDVDWTRVGFDARSQVALIGLAVRHVQRFEQWASGVEGAQQAALLEKIRAVSKVLRMHPSHVQHVECRALGEALSLAPG